MQIFANGKQRFHSFVELYVIHSKNQGEKIWSYTCSTTLTVERVINKTKPSFMRIFVYLITIASSKSLK